jgi:hypothetical protein
MHILGAKSIRTMVLVPPQLTAKCSVFYDIPPVQGQGRCVPWTRITFLPFNEYMLIRVLFRTSKHKQGSRVIIGST